MSNPGDGVQEEEQGRDGPAGPPLAGSGRAYGHQGQLPVFGPQKMDQNSHCPLMHFSRIRSSMPQSQQLPVG